jgi:hypothetical protein
MGGILNFIEAMELFHVEQFLSVVVVFWACQVFLLKSALGQ